MSIAWHDKCKTKFKLDQYVWSVEEILSCYRQASHDYSCFDKLETDDEIQRGFEACNMFIMNGHQARFLKKETIGYLDDFGPDGFFEEDLLHIVKFTETIIQLLEKIEQRPSLQANLFKSESQSYTDFCQVASMCKVINEQFVDAIKAVKERPWQPKETDKMTL